MAKVTSKKKKQETVEVVTIKPPNIQGIKISIVGTSPLCINRFGNKAKEEIMEKQQSAKAKSQKKEPKDFEASFQEARHISEEGWDGIHAAAFRNAAISACRISGYAMTRAKLSIFIEPDGFDKIDGSPLVRIKSKPPENWTSHVRLGSGQSSTIDIHARPLYREWAVDVMVRYDADQFMASDIVNLFHRVGVQVGIGEGRPDSKSSNGLGYGLFEIATNGGRRRQARK